VKRRLIISYSKDTEQFEFSEDAVRERDRETETLVPIG